MKFNYVKAQSTAKRLLNNFGDLGYVSIQRETGAVNDPITGVTPGTTEIIPLSAVDLSVDQSLVDGELIHTTDRMIICSSDDKPLATDKILIGTVEHFIVTIKPTSPSGSDVIYKVICRGQ